MSPAPFQNMPGGVKCEAQPWGVIGDSKYFNRRMEETKDNDSRRLFMNDPANSRFYDQCVGDCSGNCFGNGDCTRKCTAEHKCASKPRQHHTAPSNDGPSGKDVANFIVFGKTRRALRGARA